MIQTTTSTNVLMVTCPHCRLTQLARVVSGKAICRAPDCGCTITVQMERVEVKRA